MTLRPVEWDVLHPLDGSSIAVVRLVWLGPKRENYYRAVTHDADRSKRRLLGYWGTLNEAHEASLAAWELVTGSSISGGDRLASRAIPPQKPPPEPYESGRAAGPEKHGARQ